MYCAILLSINKYGKMQLQIRLDLGDTDFYLKQLTHYPIGFHFELFYLEFRVGFSASNSAKSRGGASIRILGGKDIFHGARSSKSHQF